MHGILNAVTDHAVGPMVEHYLKITEAIRSTVQTGPVKEPSSDCLVCLPTVVEGDDAKCDIHSQK
jgi:hypothetical protein